MGFTVKIDTHLGIIFTAAVGEIGFADILNLREAYSSSPGFSATFHQLMDLRGCTLKMTSDEAFTLAQKRIKQPLSAKLAIVAGESFGVVRMFHGWAGNDPDTSIFEDMDAAREWLGLPPEG